MMDQSDQALLMDYLRGGDAAFRELLERHAGLVYGVALRQTRNPESASEVVQDVFLVLARKATQLVSYRSVAAWLHKTAQYVARDARSAQQRHLRKLKLFSRERDLAPPEGSNDAVLAALDDAVIRLPEQEKEAIILRFFEDREYAEIAMQLRISEVAARKRVSRGVKRLQAILGAGSTACGISLATSSVSAPANLVAAVSPAIPPTTTPLSTVTILLLMTKTTAITIGAAALLAGIIIFQWNDNVKLRNQLAEADSRIKAQESEAARQPPAALTRTRGKSSSVNPIDDVLSFFFSQNGTPKIADTGSVDAQIDDILKELSGWDMYHVPNSMVPKLVGLGPDAIGPLLDHLKKGASWEAPPHGQNFAVRGAVEDALEQLLTEEDKEKILATYTESGYLSKLIGKFQISEARDAVFDRIRSGDHVGSGEIEAALVLDPEGAIPIVQEHVLKMTQPWRAYPAIKQIDLPGVDLTPSLNHGIGLLDDLDDMPLEKVPKQFVPQVRSNLRSKFARLALEHGVPEGLDLAVELLRSTETSSGDRRELMSAVRKATNAFGGDASVAEWIESNRHALSWDSQEQLFLLHEERN